MGGTVDNLVTRMKLTINRVEVSNDELVGAYITVGATAKEPYHNEVLIEMKGQETPTLGRDDLEKLRSSCKSATFIVT